MTLKGAELKSLVDKWRQEMDTRTDNWTVQIGGLKGLVTIAWWGYFKPHKLQHFMTLCVDGMLTSVAWQKAKAYKKEVVQTEFVARYSDALLKNKLYTTPEAATAEAIRWQHKFQAGLTEPLMCYPGQFDPTDIIKK